jgi:hypothetical protein
VTAPGDSEQPQNKGERSKRSRAVGPSRAQRQAVSPKKSADGAATGSEPGVLTSLPSTRPQRPNARRAAAKRATADRATPTTGQSTAGSAAKRAPNGTTRATGSTAKRGTSASAGRTVRAPIEPPVPRQGFETEDDIAPGTPLQPPSSSELATSVAELLGELTQAGLSSGGRLLKEALKRLPGAGGP